ncbi:AMP-binding enzyme [Mycobacterium sp. SMC-4]|uniref:AMP-binding enzyme n=1 Tax=Mycobacterium sp. SMC-4 TaxID=2857059 RepID=UPI0037C808B7
MKVGKTVGLPHPSLGEVVVACVVPRENASMDPEEIRRYLRGRLASYKVPRHVLFFEDADITLTGSDKIKSSDLRDLAMVRMSKTVAGQ